MSEKPKKSALIEALTKVMQEVKNPKKTGENTFQKYRYVPAAELENDVRPLLAKHGITLFVTQEEPIIKEVMGVDKRTGEEKHGTHVFYPTHYTFCHVSGEERSGIIYGEAIDWGDKATNKSITQAVKYILMANLLLGGEDAEADASVDETQPIHKSAPASHPRPAPRRSSNPAPVGPDEEVPSGKFKGKKWREVDLPYIKWIVENAPNSPLFDAARAELERRQNTDPVENLPGDELPF